MQIDLWAPKTLLLITFVFAILSVAATFLPDRWWPRYTRIGAIALLAIALITLGVALYVSLPYLDPNVIISPLPTP